MGPLLVAVIAIPLLLAGLVRFLSSDDWTGASIMLFTGCAAVLAGAILF